jgi:hypothetical protein
MTNYHFAIAATQATTRVMRLDLLPFSIGHKILLERIQSPFLAADTAPAREDLIKAVLICSRTYRENITETEGFVFRFKVKTWLRRCRKLVWARELANFRDYITQGSLCPRIKPEGGRAPGSPWTLRLLQFLTLTLKTPLNQSWDYPYGLAQFEWAAFWENENALKVVNQQEMDFEKWCDEQDALAAKAVTP